MTISSWPRLVIGTLFLLFGAAIGLVAWSVETCTGDAANALWLGTLALFANIFAWVLLGRRLPSRPVLVIAVLPALAALSYTVSTIQLAAGFVQDGLGACAVMRPGQDFGRDGDEPWFILLWLLVCVSFWGGLAPVAARAIRVHTGVPNDE